MAEVSSLRAVENKVWIAGYVEEKNLTIKPVEFTNKITGQKQVCNRISGSVTIGVGEDKIKVYVNANELKANGEENPFYTGYKTVMDEYVSRAEVLARGGDKSEITVAKVTGSLNPYDSINNSTFEIYNALNVKASFFNRGAETDTFRASFKTEIFVENVAAEEVDGKSTGRTIVNGILPVYGGLVYPVKFIADCDESCGGNVAKFILENYEVGKTYGVQGDIKSLITTKEYTHEGMFGTETRTFESIRTEYVLNKNCDIKPYLITDPKNLDKNTIRAAMLHRQEINDKKIANAREATGNSNYYAPTTTFAEPKVTMTEAELNAIEF